MKRWGNEEMGRWGDGEMDVIYRKEGWCGGDRVVGWWGWGGAVEMEVG